MERDEDRFHKKFPPHAYRTVSTTFDAELGNEAAHPSVYPG